MSLNLFVPLIHLRKIFCSQFIETFFTVDDIKLCDSVGYCCYIYWPFSPKCLQKMNTDHMAPITHSFCFIIDEFYRLPPATDVLLVNSLMSEPNKRPEDEVRLMCSHAQLSHWHPQSFSLYIYPQPITKQRICFYKWYCSLYNVNI